VKLDKPSLLTGSKRELTLLLKRRGSASLDEAEDATGLARTTLREHFSRLERDGLVKRSTVRQGKGRPSLRYALSSAGERLFPSQDHRLLSAMLDFLQAEGRADLVERFFRKYWDDRLLDVRHKLDRIDGADGKKRLEALDEILREQGFMPEIRSEDAKLIIRECNCPFPEAVKRTRLPCRLEASFFEQILDQEASRVSYIPDGSPACIYEFPVIDPS
jgi:predicted ArsR family transcriptional regulator